MTSIDLKNPPPGVFVHHSRTHFDELDPLWVLHHSRHIRHLERAQQAMFDAIMETDGFDPQRYPDLYVVVKRIEIDYLAPVREVGPFCVLLRVARLREAGLTTEFSIRSGDGEILHAKGLRTVCKLSLKTHQPAGWTPEFREKYTRWLDLGKDSAGKI